MFIVAVNLFKIYSIEKKFLRVKVTSVGGMGLRYIVLITKCLV